MRSLWRDIRYGLRGLRANPGFSALAMATLALGIGAGTTMFSVIKNVLLSPFPYKDADEIATFDIHDLDNARPGGRGWLKPAEYLEFREQNHVFSEDIGGGVEDVLWTSGEGTEQFDGAYVTPGFKRAWNMNHRSSARSSSAGWYRSAARFVNRFGMMPTSVVGLPFNTKVRPRIAGSRLHRRCHIL